MASASNDLMVGAPVYTQDGEQLGKVKEARGQLFKVDARMRPDYWLSRDCIGSMADGRVTLTVTKDRIEEYKAHDPDDDTRTDAGSVGAAATGAVSAEGMQDRDTAGHRMSNAPGSTVGADYHAAATDSTATVRGTAPRGEVTGGGMHWSWDEARPDYQREWEGRNAGPGRRWADVEPGYRYGHEMASDSRYQGREWPDVEPEMSANARDWGQRAGYHWDDDNGWDRMKEGARAAWDRSRGRAGTTGERNSSL